MRFKKQQIKTTLFENQIKILEFHMNLVAN